MTRRHGESVYYREDRKQWVAVADLGWHEGKRDRREFTSTRSKQDALLKRDTFTHRKADGFVLPKGRAPYVSEWLAHWLHNVARPNVAPTTWHRCYRQVVEDYAVPFFARIRLPDLSEEDIEAWHSWLGRRKSRKGGQLSPGTVANAHRVLGAALREAVLRGKMPRNPCSNVRPPRKAHTEMRHPGRAEVQLILERCATWPNGARWVLAFAAGLRQGEALALQWRDVKLDGPAPSVTIRRTRGRVGQEWVVKEPKSVKSRRRILLADAPVAALRAHRAAQTVVSLDGLVFTNAKGEPVHGKNDWRDLQALLADVGLPHYRVHDLRHACAVMYLEEGQDARVVQEILGHSSPAFTQAVYQHVTEGLQSRAVDAMNRALGGE